MKRRSLLLCLLAVLASGTAPALAQRPERDFRAPGQQFRTPGMSKDERERMRDDMREVYRGRDAEHARQERPRQMSPEEREKLRRDIQDANKDLRR